jgi:hypothetical protein
VISHSLQTFGLLKIFDDGTIIVMLMILFSIPTSNKISTQDHPFLESFGKSSARLNFLRLMLHLMESLLLQSLYLVYHSITYFLRSLLFILYLLFVFQEKSFYLKNALFLANFDFFC